MEAEALPVMMEATWQQVEQDVRRACYQIAVLVGTGWMEMRKKDTQQQEGTAQKSVWDGADEAEAVAREAESWAAGVPPVVVDDVGEERHRRAVALAAVGRVAVQRATEAIHAAREGARGAERKEDIETVSDAHHVWRAITVAAHSAAEKMLGGATGGSG